MPKKLAVFNWIEARFAGGADFVSDAPNDVADEIAELLAADGRGGDALEFGWRALESRPLAIAYLRCPAQEPPAGGRFVHAVVAPSEELGAPTEPALEALFRAHYGADLEIRIEELARQLADLPVHGAAAEVTDLFIDRKELSMLRNNRATEPQPSASIRIAHLQLPWLLTTLAVGAAGFFAGSRLEVQRVPPPVSAPPPELALRIDALERSQLAAASRVDAELEQVRARYSDALAAKDREIAALGERISALAPPEAPPQPLVAQLEPSSRDARAEAQPRAAEPAAKPLDVQRARNNSAASGRAEEPAEPPTAKQPAVPTGLRLAEVRAPKLRVRSGPGPKHAVVAQLRKGARVVTANEQRNGWVRLEVPNRGWVDAEFLAAIGAEPRAKPPDD